MSRAYTRHDALERRLLEYSWPHGGGTYSFDLGGSFVGEHLDGLVFLAEVKNYKNGNGLPAMFRDFVAKSYVAALGLPDTTQFLWISWAPFGSTNWDSHCDPSSVTEAILEPVHRQKVTGLAGEQEARESISVDIVASLSTRLWMVTLSERQEHLVPTLEHFESIRGSLARLEVT